MKLYNYFRSSASYRVRIALALKGLDYDYQSVHLPKNEQFNESYAAVSATRLVPTLVEGDQAFTQSLAIIEYLDECYAGPRLLPSTARERARVRNLAQLIACDIHPLANLRVMQYLEKEFNTPQVERERWIRHWITEGFQALEKLLSTNPSTGECCEGDNPSIADLCLVPQVYNAQRYSVDMAAFPTIRRVNEHCLTLRAFDAARPEKQPDAPAAN